MRTWSAEQLPRKRLSSDGTTYRTHSLWANIVRTQNLGEAVSERALRRRINSSYSLRSNIPDFDGLVTAGTYNEVSIFEKSCAGNGVIVTVKRRSAVTWRIPELSIPEPDGEICRSRY